MITEASYDLKFSKFNDAVSCPQCKQAFQILNPQEGLIYSCHSCDSQFILFKKDRHYETSLWSEDDILKKILEVPTAVGPSQVSRLWKAAFQNLDNPQSHRDFVDLCRRMNHLDCARDKYKLLKIYMNWEQIPADVKEVLYPTPQVEALWKQRLPWGLLGLSALFVLVGLLHPGLKNMFGAGVIMAVLTFGFYREKLKI